MSDEKTTIQDAAATDELRRKPIRYHVHLDESAMTCFASEYGSTSDGLRAETEKAIRERFADAVVMPGREGDGKRPDIYTLSLPGPTGFLVHFSNESREFVVRGYFYDIGDREPLDFRDGGYICCDHLWFPPPDIANFSLADKPEPNAYKRLQEKYGPVFHRLVVHFRLDVEKAKDYMENAHAGEYVDLGECN